MKVLVIYAHPEPKSINGTLYRATVEELVRLGHDVQVSDLYQMGFDPVSGPSNFNKLQNPEFFKQQLEEIYASDTHNFNEIINQEQQKVEWCDIMIWHFPLWWASVPAILKGWVDKVFAMGRFYGQEHLYENGKCKGKKAMLCFTTGAPQEAYVGSNLFGVLGPLHRGIFSFLGFSVLKAQVIHGPARKAENELLAAVEDWKKRLATIASEEARFIEGY